MGTLTSGKRLPCLDLFFPSRSHVRYIRGILSRGNAHSLRFFSRHELFFLHTTDVDTHGREAEAVLGRAAASRGSSHCSAAEGRVDLHPDVVPPSFLAVEVSPGPLRRLVPLCNGFVVT